jgi:preprotein translocase subunit SecF
MEFFNPKKLNLNFSRWFKFFTILSITASVLSVILIVKPGINYGVDFSGGVDAQTIFKKDISSKEIRVALEKKLKNVTVVSFNDVPGVYEFSIKAQADADTKANISKLLTESLTESFGPSSEETWTVKKMDVVGPTVGASLKKSAILSIIFTCLLITIYIYWRFDLRFTPGALFCIFHDLAIVTGVIVLTGMEFSTTTVAALLTLAGYSINDTVVVYDRIRELESKFASKTKRDLVNFAVNTTLSRTTMTAGTTLVSCVVLYFVGGPALRDFASVLFIGIIVGTYSSIFVASPMYVWADEHYGAQAVAAAKAKAQGRLSKART